MNEPLQFTYRDAVEHGLPLPPECIEWFDECVRRTVLYGDGDRYTAPHLVVNTYRLGWGPFDYENHLWLTNNAKKKATRIYNGMRGENV